MPDEIVFESPADQAGFVMLPNVVLMDPSISHACKVLYALFIHHAREKDRCFPGQARLANLMTVTERAVRGYVRELEVLMLIRTEKVGRRNRYVLLALGLRAKRMDEHRNSASGDEHRNSASGHTGTLFPTKEMKEGNPQEGSLGRLRIAGKPVDRSAWALAKDALAEFNQQAGRKYRVLTSAGKPSEAAKRVYLRIIGYPDLQFEDHADIIRRTLASKWWGSAPPEIGHVYGPKIFEENITRQGIPKQAKTDAKKKRAEEDRAAIARVLARAQGEAA